MEKIFNEIIEILKNSPSRFAKIFYRATIEVIGTDVIKVKITSTLDFYNNVSPNINLTLAEKWDATGLAIGSLEHYLEKKELNFNTVISKTSTEETVAEITINV